MHPEYAIWVVMYPSSFPHSRDYKPRTFRANESYLSDLVRGRRIIVDTTFSISSQGYRTVHSRLPRSSVSANSTLLDRDYSFRFLLSRRRATVFLGFFHHPHILFFACETCECSLHLENTCVYSSNCA